MISSKIKKMRKKKKIKMKWKWVCQALIVVKLLRTKVKFQCQVMKKAMTLKKEMVKLMVNLMKILLLQLLTKKVVTMMVTRLGLKILKENAKKNYLKNLLRDNTKEVVNHNIHVVFLLKIWTKFFILMMMLRLYVIDGYLRIQMMNMQLLKLHTIIKLVWKIGQRLSKLIRLKQIYLQKISNVRRLHLNIHVLALRNLESLIL